MTSVEQSFLDQFPGLDTDGLWHTCQTGSTQINSIELVRRLMALQEAGKLMREFEEETASA